MSMEASAVVTLLDVPAGERARVTGLDADIAMRSRLYALGFTPGVEVEICPGCCSEGARRVIMRGSALVLGESTAKSIMCECCCPESVNVM